MSRLIPTFLFLSMFAPLAWAEQKAADLARPIASFVDERTFAVLRLDLARLDLDALRKQLTTLLPNLPSGAAVPPPEMSKGVDFLKNAGVRQVYALFSTAGVPQGLPLVVLVTEKGTDLKNLAEKLTESKQFPPMRFEVCDNVVIGADEATRERLRKLQPINRPEIAQGFEALGSGAVQLVAFWPGESRRILEETMPHLPDPLGGGSIKVLTRGLKWVAGKLETQPKLRLSLIAQAQNAESATALKDLWQKTLAALRQQGTVQNVLPQFDQLSRMLVPEVSKDRLVVKVEGEKLAASLQAPLDKIRLASQRTVSSNNLKQIGLAMHNYLDAHKSRFPGPAILDKQGKPLLSWRVQLLPYLAQEELYKEFHLDEPWDSEHNKKLIAKMPAVFASPGTKATAGKTTYLAPVGRDTVFADPKGMKITDITDGTSSTILLVDVPDDQAVVWTKPADWSFNPKQPLRGLGIKYGAGFLALFCDGSVRFIHKAVDPDVLKALITPQGGEPAPEK